MSNKQKNFIVQASILAIAGIMVRIIGLLYRVPLTNIIGDKGNGYYAQAYNIYAIILLISSYSIPLAVSKVVSAKLAFREYRNAHRVFLCALIYVTIVGGVASLVLFFGAPLFVDETAVIVLRVFSPTIFFYGILGVLRGYFQAHGSMVQTSVSQIIEQLLNAVISIVAAYLFTNAVLNSANPENAAIYGAAGSAIGTGAGVVIGLLFMLFVYKLNRSFIHRRLAKDVHEEVESYSSIFRTIFFLVTPVIFSTFVYNCSTALDMKVYYQISYAVKSFTDEMANVQYGIFSTKFMVLMNVPVALASSFSTAMIPSVSRAYATRDMEQTNNRIQEAIRLTMIISIPAAVGMSVLAHPIMALLFPQPESLPLASSLLKYGTICVIFYSLSTMTNGVLQGIGKVNVPIRNAVIALIGHWIVLIPILYFTDLDLYALLIGTGAYSLLMCILNGTSVKKYLGFRQEIKKTFIVPGIAALLMGGVVWAAYYGIFVFVRSTTLGLCISIPLGVLAYFILLIKLKGVDEDELRGFPKGHYLVRAAKKLRLL